jgi:HEAT repeat protein
MGSLKTIINLTTLLSCSFLFGEFEEQRINFLIGKKEYATAIDFYLKNIAEKNVHQPDLLRYLAKSIIENSIKSSDPKEQMLGLYGLMISGAHDTDYDYSALIESKDPYVQMLSIQYLSGWNEDIVETWLNKAMSSPFLPVRMQALGSLVQLKSKLALSHIESLYYRLPPYFRPIFAQFYAALGTPHSIKILKQMLSDPNPEMKIATMLSATEYRRDDLRDDIKKILSQPDPQVQESAIFAASHLQDLRCVELLQNFTHSTHTNLKLAAILGLLSFFDEKNKPQLFELAQEGNLFAIFSLGAVDGSEEVLVKLAKTQDYNIKLNTMAALLEKKHPLAKDLLIDFYRTHSPYDGIAPSFSVGKTQTSLKIFPAFSKQFEKSKEYSHYIQGMTYMIRSRFLIQALELQEADFLQIAETIFEQDIYDVIPTLVHLLENCHSEKALAMVKKMSQKVGSPRTRLYCLIALARMKDQNHIQLFFDFLSTHRKQELIQLQMFDTQDSGLKDSSRFILSPDENSQLLLEAYETLVYLHDERSFGLILNTLSKSIKQNQPVLAGILLKALL